MENTKQIKQIRGFIMGHSHQKELLDTNNTQVLRIAEVC